MFRRYLMVVALSITASTPAVSAPDATPDATGLLRKGDFQHLEQYFSAVQSRFREGQASAEELRNAFRAFYPTDRSLTPKYDAWVSKYPKSYAARVARGIFYKKIGYEERGGKYISETSEIQITKMDLVMQKAIRDLGASIKMDQKPFLSYFHMIDIASSYAGIAQSGRLILRRNALKRGSSWREASSTSVFSSAKPPSCCSCARSSHANASSFCWRHAKTSAI